MATSFPFDTRIRLTMVWKQDGVATDPTTTTLRIEDPAGTVTVETSGGNIVKDATGSYYFDLDAALAGVWEYRWEADTPKGAAENFFTMEKSRIDILNP